MLLIMAMAAAAHARPRNPVAQGADPAGTAYLKTADLYMSAVTLAGAGVTTAVLRNWHSADLPRFCFYLILAVLAGAWKVNLPGLRSAMPVCFIFVFVGIGDLGPAETLVIGCAGTLMRCLWKPDQSPQPLRVAFSVEVTAI